MGINSQLPIPNSQEDYFGSWGLDCWALSLSPYEHG